MRRLAFLAVPFLLALSGCGPRARISEPCAVAMKHLQQRERMEDVHLRRHAARELAQYPEAAPATIPILIEAVKDADLYVSAFAASALMQLTGQDFGRRHADWKKWFDENGARFRPEETPTLVDQVRKSRARLAYTNGRRAMGARSYRQAAYHFSEAISNDPTDATYHNDLGVALLRMGLYTDAVEKFHDALAREPKLAGAHMNVGEVHRQRARDHAIVFSRFLREAREAHAYGRKEEAEEKAAKAVDAAEKRAKSLEAAVDAYRVAISIEKEERRNWQPRLGLGRVLLDLKQYDKALEVLGEAREIDASQPDIHSALALVYYARDQYHLAWKAYQEVRRLGCEMQPEFVQRLRDHLEASGGAVEP